MLIPGSHFLNGLRMSKFLALISINYKVITFLDLNAASNTAPVVRVLHNRQSILGNAWQSMPQLPGNTSGSHAILREAEFSGDPQPHRAGSPLTPPCFPRSLLFTLIMHCQLSSLS